MAAALALPGTAQTPPPIDDVAHVSVELDSGWTLESAIVDGELVGFFAWIPQAEVTPGNVYLAWLEHVGGGAWTMYGWTTGDAANAVAAIEEELGDATSLDGVNTLDIDGSLLTDDPCDTGIQPGGPGGTAMPSGVTTTDPAAPLMEAVADDPTTAIPLLDALAQSGASAAPGLSDLLITASLCPGTPQSDVALTLAAYESPFDFAPGEDVEDILATAACGGGVCFPWTWIDWAPWTAWSCTGGPTYTNFTSLCAGCKYTGCTRSRWGIRRFRKVDCSEIIIGIPTKSEGPTVKVCPLAANLAVCPPQPTCP